MTPPGAGAPAPSADLDARALKRAIRARLRDFDVSALLDLLAAMGYQPADITFRGHLASAPQPTLLHSIEFGDDPAPPPGAPFAEPPGDDPGDLGDLGDLGGLAPERDVEAELAGDDDTGAFDVDADPVGDADDIDFDIDIELVELDDVELDVFELDDVELDVFELDVIELDAPTRELPLRPRPESGRQTRPYPAALRQLATTAQDPGRDDEPTEVYRLDPLDLLGDAPPDVDADTARQAPPADDDPGQTPAPPAVAGPDRRLVPSGRARPGARPAVMITVNLGLLSCRSPLPTYFGLFLRQLHTYEPLVELLRILDRTLLRVRLCSDVPDRVFRDWDDMLRDFQRIHGLDSVIGLDWLFRHVFPELRVTVRRVPDELRFPYFEARLGAASLGECSLGSVTRVAVHEFEVTLTCPTALYHYRVPWIHEADQRLRTVVFPILDEVCMSLTIALVVLDQSSYARLSSDSYIGYDPLHVPGSDGSLPPRRLVLYRGTLPRTEPDTDELERALASDEDIDIGPDYRPWASRAAPGFNVKLDVRYELFRRVYTYEATIKWGAREWYRDEPYAISLRFDGLPKAAPIARHHPNLWALLRARARQLIADRLTRGTLDQRGADHVTRELIDDLAARGRAAELHALLLSDLTPVSTWGEGAWERFLDWSAS